MRLDLGRRQPALRRRRAGARRRAHVRHLLLRAAHVDLGEDLRSPARRSSGWLSMYCRQPSARMLLPESAASAPAAHRRRRRCRRRSRPSRRSSRRRLEVLQRGLRRVDRVRWCRTEGRRPEDVGPRGSVADPLAAQGVGVEHRAPVRRHCAVGRARVAGSSGSVPATTLSMSARSETERVIAPPKSVIQISGMMPVPLSRPSVPRSVTRLAPLAGA